jgi:hypothetical protein
MYVFLSSGYLTLQSAAYAYMEWKRFSCVYWWMRLFYYAHIRRKIVSWILKVNGSMRKTAGLNLNKQQKP